MGSLQKECMWEIIFSERIIKEKSINKLMRSL